MAKKSTLLFVYILCVIAALNLSCSGLNEASSEHSTPTFGPEDATATWVAFKPERDRIAGEILEKQSASSTVVAATQLAMIDAPSDADKPDLEQGIVETPVTKTLVREIVNGPVNRIAVDNGKGSIYTIDPNGQNLTPVAKGSNRKGEFRFTFPVWSPDGGTLLFSSFIIVEESVSQSALHRAYADGSGEIVTLAVDPTSQSGVGPGVPHFSTWSPVGDRIALTTSGEFGIGSMLLGSNSGESPEGIAVGAPLYINWAPNGSAILVHQDSELYLIRIENSGTSAPVLIGSGSDSYNSASWAPDSKSFAYVDAIDGSTSIVVTKVEDINDQDIIGSGASRVALGWSPSGDRMAIARSSGEAFHTLSIYDLNEQKENILFKGQTRAFWWSPDGTKIAVIDDSPEIELAHQWLVIEVDTGAVVPLVTQVLSDQFLFVQVFFDQYVDSHNIWSPDSTQIVVSGAVIDPSAVTDSDGVVLLPERFDSQIWVLDASGDSPPKSLGSGTIASWSSQ